MLNILAINNPIAKMDGNTILKKNLFNPSFGIIKISLCFQEFALRTPNVYVSEL